MLNLKVTLNETNTELNVVCEKEEPINIDVGEVIEVESEGSKDHDLLFNRDKQNQHPTSSITGLDDMLDKTVKKDDLDSISFIDIDTVFSGVLRRRLK